MDSNDPIDRRRRRRSRVRRCQQLALAGFLAGYRGLTRDAYALDLRQFVTWCEGPSSAAVRVRRADIESFARDLEAFGRAWATVARRLCTVAGFYRYAEQEGLLARSPAVHVRRLRLDYESHATGLDRNEIGALLVAAGLGSASDHALGRCWRSTGCACPKRSAPTPTPSASRVGIGP
ncbi:MAG: site-specific integrase [Acidimicrobiales bacterium]